MQLRGKNYPTQANVGLEWGTYIGFILSPLRGKNYPTQTNIGLEWGTHIGFILSPLRGRNYPTQANVGLHTSPSLVQNYYACAMEPCARYTGGRIVTR